MTDQQMADAHQLDLLDGDVPGFLLRTEAGELIQSEDDVGDEAQACETPRQPTMH